MKRKEKKFLIFAFFSWRVLTFLFLFLSISILPLQMHFLGGGLTNYLQKPYFWAWANFDGEHYLGIAQRGYGYLEHAFFPVYPFSIQFGGRLLGGSLADFNSVGLLISNAFFFITLVGLYKLIRLDFPEKIAKLTITLLLIFPTSFYFGSVYTESLFLAFVVWSFYYARQKRWWRASLLGALASATRFLGILLLPAYLFELWREEKFKDIKKALKLMIIPLGLAGFMYYLYITEGDPLKFIKVLPGYGEQRQITPVILPQVYYRYLVKILPNINYNYIPIILTTYLEVLIALLFLALIVLIFVKLRLSYAIFALGAYLIPTLTGSFSSLPRYVLIIFPAFILAALYLSKASRTIQILTYALLFICLAVATALFVRGYWVA